MFELKFEDKVKVWRNLRDQLETHPRPYESVLQFVNKLPISAKKPNAWDPKAKVEPWHLIEKSEFTEYEIGNVFKRPTARGLRCSCHRRLSFASRGRATTAEQ